MVGGRLVMAAIMALVTGAACVAAAGFGGDTPRDAGLLIPALLPGDAAVYASGEHLVFENGFEVDDELIVRFSEEPWFAPDGHMEPRLTLRHALDSRGWGLKLWLDGTHVLASKAFVESDGATGTLHAGPAGDQVVGGYYNTYETRHVDPLLPFCGLVHSLQGAAVRPDVPLHSPGCPADLALVSTRNGTATFDDGAGTRLVASAMTPLPTSITTEGKTWNLTAFSRGEEPEPMLPTAAVPIGVQAGEAPDAAGIDQTFAYDEALAAALAGPAPNALRTFMAGHPDAYIAEASFTEIQDGANHRYHWHLVASDGSGAAAVGVWREGAQAVVPQAGVSQPVGMLPVPVVRDAEAPTRAFPTNPPASFPTLASLKARWESNRVEAAPESNAWGFRVLCGTDCDDPLAQTWYGLDLHWTLVTCGDAGEADPVFLVCDPFRPLWIRDQLTVDGQGRSLWSLTTTWRFYNEFNVGDQQLVADGIGSPPAEGVPARPDAAGVAWALPAGQVAVGATFLGLLAGLAYLLWPNLKFALVGLVKDAREPNNPVRAAIVQAIEGRPGIHYQELRRTLGKAGGTIRHHLRLLEHDRVIVSHVRGGYRCFFPAAGVRRDLVASAGVLKAETARRILHGIVEAGHLSMGQAAARAGVTASAATHHAVRMEEAGLLTRTRNGRAVELRPTARAPAALAASAL